MENAVKAIFIAGTLIIILSIVSVIVNVFLKNSIVIDDAAIKIDVNTIAYHNSQFTIYEKDNLTFNKLQSLIGQIVENNNRQTDERLMVSVDVEQYGQKPASMLYESKGTYIRVDKPIDSNFTKENWCPYLDSTSVYRGDYFKVTLNYNDAGIVDIIRIDNIE